MVGKSKAAVISALAILALVASVSARAQSEQKDSLVRLMQASSLQLIEESGQSFRKAVDATFLHNGTYLVCDTALWNVETERIHCEGHVQLIQDQTILTSDRLDYSIPDNLAEFRGTMVQLRNSSDDMLRTHHLDYNTRDSMAIFLHGGSMKDKNGQIIESERGAYESVLKRFTFEKNVEMFADSIFVKTERLTYDSDPNIVNFETDIDFWKDGNMLSGKQGWYRRGEEIFFFQDNVHSQSREQEAWSDSLYYYRNTNDIEMRGHAQVQDTTRNMFGLADFLYYSDTLAQVTMRRNAAVAVRSQQGEQVDTLYCGADEFQYHTEKRCDIADNVISSALARLNEIMADPVNAYRKKAAEEAAKTAAEEADKRKKERGLDIPQKPSNGGGEENPDEAEAAPAINVAPSDTAAAPADSLSVPLDTIAPLPDTSKIGFLIGLGHVRMFRKDIQLRCDSLRYNDLDSIVRCYKEPFIWNEGNRQYTSDSLFILVRNGGVDRASLMSNAFIITQEADTYFDQIKGTDVMAYFDSTAALRRFDALGGATALFYLQENEEYATANKVECKMMSATMKEGSLEKVYYFDQPKNNAYPIVQLPPTDVRMRGFNWKPENRPRGREDITALSVRPSERTFYDARPKTTFEYTGVYFPGYMDGVYKSIEDAKEQERLARISRDSLENAVAVPDLFAAQTDSVAVSDSLSISPDIVTESADSLNINSIQDSLSVNTPADSLFFDSVADSLVVETPAEPSAKQIRAQERQRKKEESELARQMRIARRDARWAELDARDAAKAEKKEARKQARRQAREEMLRRREEKQAAREQAKLQMYVDKFEKQKIRNERKQQAPLEPGL